MPVRGAGVIEDVIRACLELVFGGRLYGRKCVLMGWLSQGRKTEKGKTRDDNWRFGWSSRM